MNDFEHCIIGAQHEFAHALAYLFFKRKFKAVDVDADGLGIVSVDHSPISQMDQSYIAAAGMAIELRYTRAFGRSTEDWLQTLATMAQDPDSEEDDDLFHTNGYFFVSLPWALAFNEAYWPEIEGGGKWLLASGGHLLYPAVASRFRQLFEPSPQRSIDMQLQLDVLAPHQDLIESVDKSVKLAASSRP